MRFASLKLGHRQAKATKEYFEKEASYSIKRAAQRCIEPKKHSKILPISIIQDTMRSKNSTMAF